MQKTPNSNRTTIAIVGDTNAGKSSLLNAIMNQDISIVSEVHGTTTDVVKKPMEFLPYGPVLFIDTAGLDDETSLGEKRVKKSIDEIKKSDFILHVIDGNNFNINKYNEIKHRIKTLGIHSLTIINKNEIINDSKRKEIENLVEKPIFISTRNSEDILNLKRIILENLEKIEEDPSLLKGILSYGDTALLVVPIDSEAPKGRLILPQVQLMRDALDNGIKLIVCRDTELEETLKDYPKIDLVITDSQAFKKVYEIVGDKYPLTGFSILFARQKGELDAFVEGARILDNLKEGARILIAETCTHNTSHEDIGRFKIPRGLEKKLGKKFNFTFLAGQNFIDQVENYDLIIHCGACMITRKAMMTRIKDCQSKNIKITNYGIVLAYIQGILDESLKSLKS